VVRTSTSGPERTNYDINIDNDGDAFADVVYRWRFRTHHRNPDSFIYNNGQVTSLDDANLLIYQTYDLTRIEDGHTTTLLDNAPVVPSHVGDASMPDYNGDLFDAGVRAAGNGRSSWVGQSDDPFFLDLRVFDLLYGGDFSRGRGRHAGRVQRQHDGPAGAEGAAPRAG
jgi:Domain of unknown function (DUF4331)